MGRIHSRSRSRSRSRTHSVTRTVVPLGFGSQAYVTVTRGAKPRTKFHMVHRPRRPASPPLIHMHSKIM